MKMTPPEMEVLHFNNEDVIATSGGGTLYNIIAGTTEGISHPDHHCNIQEMHVWYYDNGSATDPGNLIFDKNALFFMKRAGNLTADGNPADFDKYYYFDGNEIYHLCPGSN